MYAPLLPSNVAATLWVSTTHSGRGGVPSLLWQCKSHLVNTFGDLIRKMWDPRNFKSHVSPHELIQVRPPPLLTRRQRYLSSGTDMPEFTTGGRPVAIGQAVVRASNKRFQIGVSSDPIEFLSWLLNTLHRVRSAHEGACDDR